MLPLVLLGALVADAPPPLPATAPTRLVYAPGVFAAVCPTEQELKAGVSRRLGLDPFAEPATRVVLVTLAGDAIGLVVRRANVELLNDELETVGARVLESDEGCKELLEAVALAVSIALDPARALAPPPVVSVPTPSQEGIELGPSRVLAPPLVEVPSTSPPPAPPAATSVGVLVDRVAMPSSSSVPMLPRGSLVVGVGGQGTLLFLSSPTAGPHAFASVRTGELSVDLDARLDVPRDLFGNFGAGAAATLAPCWHAPLGSFRRHQDIATLLCTTASVGGAAEVTPTPALTPYLGLGGRVGVEWSQADGSSVAAFAQAEWALLPPLRYGLTGASPSLTQSLLAQGVIGVRYGFAWDTVLDLLGNSEGPR